MRVLFTLIFILMTFNSIGQKKALVGKVLDKETQEPLKGANIVILGGTHGTMSDDEGYFEFNELYRNSIARISYLGYKHYDVKLISKKILVAELEKEYLLLPTMNIGLGQYTGPVEYVESKQNISKPKTSEFNTIPDLPEEEIEEVMVIVEDPASFHAGLGNLYAFFASNFQYPERVLHENLSGEVYIQFTVLPTGSVRIDRFINDEIPIEVVDEMKRIFNIMPNWTPAKQRGENVAQGFIIALKYAANGY